MDFSNCITIVKFFKNPSSEREDVNPLITRTMKKIGVIDKAYKPDDPESSPKDGEFWKVIIKDEIRPGKPEGCFILTPITAINPTDVVKLLPGMYEERREDSAIAIIPKDNNHNWVLPLRHKQKIDAHTIVVVLGKSDTGATT